MSAEALRRVRHYVAVAPDGYVRAERNGPPGTDPGPPTRADLQALLLALAQAWHEGYVVADNGRSEDENPYGVVPQLERPAGARYIVLRGARDLPDGYMPRELEGQWLDPVNLERGPKLMRVQVGYATAYAVERYEIREDGARAQVYEVRRG